ncbi:Serine Threonine protein kinase and Signal Transduction Histidine Kinase (STHK) with GAF [Seminavis robusta]|uniref:Serine Threonine protein kinase and Signal Transduction Histidine Kinase (STHK) with GAF n=1 Tax=Seminavis robusta TaxID=568900 RepID=A0A9N8DA87_9STRA|nr:Serine Threonine protein kinase and Signal Transduction Histidine Kinase (STHK) with GAF [Seminavis robusta]|eukprot:Sro9_g007710.1 Serine Threonine protein kinase and Signal Transduction Histidine Kinase (STHK) with GAF (1469) ;mRNA; f:226435-231028
MVMTSVVTIGGSGAQQEQEILRQSVVEPLLHNELRATSSMFEQEPEFQAGAPLSSLWKARTMHQPESSSSTSTSLTTDTKPHQEKQQQDQNDDGCEENQRTTVKRPQHHQQAESTSCSSCASSSSCQEEQVLVASASASLSSPDETCSHERRYKPPLSESIHVIEDKTESTDASTACAVSPHLPEAYNSSWSSPVIVEELDRQQEQHHQQQQDEEIPSGPSTPDDDSAQPIEEESQNHDETKIQSCREIPVEVENIDACNGADPEDAQAHCIIREAVRQRTSSIDDSNTCRTSNDEQDAEPSRPTDEQQQQQQQQHTTRPQQEESIEISHSNRTTTTTTTNEEPASPKISRQTEKKLDWSFLKDGTLYDRDKEIKALQDAFRRQIQSAPPDSTYDNPEEERQQSLVLVSGHSGTGKSALVRNALKPLVINERNGCYLTGKFDQLQHNKEPYAPFVNAINDYVYHVLHQQKVENKYTHMSSLSFLESLQTEILSALRPEGCNILLQMIPALAQIVQMNGQAPNNLQFSGTASAFAFVNAFGGAGGAIGPITNTREGSQDRLKIIFRRFLRVICKPERPCVLVLDDLQWADSSSLDLMESLICDGRNNNGLFLVGICRSNEITMGHNLAALLRRLEDQRNVHIHNIVAHNLSFNATNQLICDVLKQPWDICLPLTEIIHEQADEGNVFHVVNYMKALHADKVLIQDVEYGTGGWLWDEERWERLFNDNKPRSKRRRPRPTGKQLHESPPPQQQQQHTCKCGDIGVSPMEDLILRQIRRLPQDVQLFLRTCACIGTEIDLSLVEKVLGEEIYLPMTVRVAVEEGLLVALDRSCSGDSSGRETSTARCYKWEHDCFQSAAYTTIPEEKKSAMHLSVGRMLFKNMPSMEDFYDHIFVVVNQMNRGMIHIEDQGERDGLAALNLKAGNRAAMSSDFHSAIRYFVVGTTLLSQGPFPWSRQYELSLELHSALAEAEYCVADYEMMDIAILEVLANAVAFPDMIRTYATKVYSLGAQFHLQEAIDLGLKVLERCDEAFSDPLPSRKKALSYFQPPMKTKRKLRFKTKSQLLYMPDMCDEDKLAAMGILNLLTTYSLIGRPSLFPYIAARLVRLSLDYGLCAISAPGFAFFGLWCCSIGDVSRGYRYGTLALDILEERYQNTISEWVPRVYSIFYGWIAPWKQSLQSTFEPTQHAHRVGLETGDIEYAMIGAHVYGMNAFFAGMPLNELEGEMRKFVSLMNLHKQGPWAAATSVQLQLIHNLMGKAENPLVLRGEIMTDEKVREIASLQNMESYEMYFVQVMVWNMLLAYHLGEIRQALVTARECREAIKSFGSSFLVVIQYFYDGMIALAAAADPHFENSKKEHLSVAARAIGKLKKIAKQCPENCLHKLFLLQADFEAVKGSIDKAVVLYGKSIAKAHENGFLQDEALAQERAGVALWHDSNNPRSNLYLNRALELYSKYGAEAIVDRLHCRYFR